MKGKDRWMGERLGNLMYHQEKIKREYEKTKEAMKTRDRKIQNKALKDFRKEVIKRTQSSLKQIEGLKKHFSFECISFAEEIKQKNLRVFA